MMQKGQTQLSLQNSNLREINLTMLINKPLQQDCELCVLLHCFDWGQVMQSLKGMLVAVIDLLDMGVGDHNVWQEL